MRVIIKQDAAQCAKWAADYVSYKIKRHHPTPNKPFVLGLPTGSTPLGMYQELIKQCASGKVSFEHVATFNMDEYIGLPPEHPQSYHYFMKENFFKHINIQTKNIHILNGMTRDYEKECTEYENAITFQAELIETKMTPSFPVLTISEDGAQLRELRLQSDTLIRASDGTVIPPSQADRLTPGQRVRFTLTCQGQTVARSADSAAASPMLGYVRQDFGPLKADRLTVSTTTGAT